LSKLHEFQTLTGAHKNQPAKYAVKGCRNLLPGCYCVGLPSRRWGVVARVPKINQSYHNGSFIGSPKRWQIGVRPTWLGKQI